ncbi:MAG: PepSY domain-containing protein [Methylocella sp.]
MLYFIAVFVTAYLGSSAAARTEPEADRVCFSTAETREKILAHGLFEPFRVMRSAANRSQAEAIGVKLCRWSEEFVYEMSLLRHDGRVIHVFVNAKTGRVIGSKNEPMNEH